MKKHFTKILFIVLIAFTTGSAQEKYGKTLNLGVAATFYGYVGRAVPAVTLNYEFDVIKNLTLAPSVGYFSYRHYHYWGGAYGHNKHYYYNYYPYERYYYRQTVIPIGVKGSYYFDDLLNANESWDFYAAATIGFAIRTLRWENEYYGETFGRRSSLYADLHIGTEYHINPTIGVFADLSLGMVNIGLSLHHK